MTTQASEPDSSGPLTTIVNSPFVTAERPSDGRPNLAGNANFAGELGRPFQGLDRYLCLIDSCARFWSIYLDARSPAGGQQ